MTTRKNLLWVLGLALCTLPGCIIDLDDDDFGPCDRGRGAIVEEVINVPLFSGIDLQMSADVFVTQGPQFEVVVRGYRNHIDLLERRVRDDTWEIDLDGCTRNPDDLTIYITVPDIRYLEISGSGNIVSENVLQTNDIDLRIDGSGDIDVALDVDDVFAEVRGSGDIFLEGVGDELFYELDGSGDLRAFDCRFNEARIDIFGSGDSEVFVEDRLLVRIDGSGDVLYRGNPDITVEIDGSGDLIDAN
jgi:hypothetical protein